MPKYQLKNQYSSADLDPHRVVGPDASDALLEAVAMAGLVGILRQLGDLAEFAAEIFHDLHEEVMSTATRGHGLMTRVQQLEADFLSVEKAILTQTNHSRFTYKSGIAWHPSSCLDQNVITQGNLPSFIMGSYEKCRAPPRLFLLDKFDIAGSGACLKRYSDPSIYTKEFASSRLKKGDIKRENKVRKVKKKGTRWWNEEPPDIFTASDFVAKLHKLADENDFSEEAPKHFGLLKETHLNGSSKSSSAKSYMDCILDFHPPMPSPEQNEIFTDDIENEFFHKKTRLELGKNAVETGGAKIIPMDDKELDISSTCSVAEKDIFIDDKVTMEVGNNCSRFNEFEIAKDSTIPEHVDKRDVIVCRGSMGLSGAIEHRPGQGSDALKDSSVASHGWSSSLKIHDSGHSDLDNVRCSTDLQSTPGSLVATSDIPNNVEPSLVEQKQAMLAPSRDSFLRPSEKMKSCSGEAVPNPFSKQIHDLSSVNFSGSIYSQNLQWRPVDGRYDPAGVSQSIVEASGGSSSTKVSVIGDELKFVSVGSLVPNYKRKNVASVPSQFPEFGESSSYIPVSHSRSTLKESLSELQEVRFDPAEVSSCSANASNSPPSPDGKRNQVGSNISSEAVISSLSSEANEGVQSIPFAKPNIDTFSNALLQPSVILEWSCAMNDVGDSSKEAFPTVYTEECPATEILEVKTLDCVSRDFPGIKTSDKPSVTNDCDLPVRAPKEYVEENPVVENSLNWKFNLNIQDEPDSMIKQYQDAYTCGTSRKTYSKNIYSHNQSLSTEDRVPTDGESLCSRSVIGLKTVKDFEQQLDETTTESIVFESHYEDDMDLLESHMNDLGRIPTESSECEALTCSNQQLHHKAFESVERDLTAGEEGKWRHLDSINVMEGCSPGSMSLPIMRFPVGASLPVDIIETSYSPAAHNLSDHTPEGINLPKTAGDHKEIQDECPLQTTVRDQYKRPINKSSMQEDIIGSQIELNPVKNSPNSLNLVSYAQAQDASNSIDCGHHLNQIHMHLGNENFKAFVNLNRANQELNLKSSHCDGPLKNSSVSLAPTQLPLEPTDDSKQGVGTVPEPISKTIADSTLSRVSENESGFSPEYSYIQFETLQTKVKNGDSRDQNEGIPYPSPHEAENREMFSLSSSSPDSSTSASFTPSFPAISSPNTETIKRKYFAQQPHQLIPSLPLTDINFTRQNNSKEMPPLPPLPPLEWRMGKFEFDFPLLDQEIMVYKGTSLQVPKEENENSEHAFVSDGESPEPLNFSTTIDDGESQSILQHNFDEIPQHSKPFTSFSAEEAEKFERGMLSSGEKMILSRSSSAPLLVVQDEKDSQHRSGTLPIILPGESESKLQTNHDEMPQPSNSFTLAPISGLGDERDSQSYSVLPVILDGESEIKLQNSYNQTQQLSSSLTTASTSALEDPPADFFSLREEMVPTQSSSMTLPFVEVKINGKPEDGSLTCDGGSRQQVNSSIKPSVVKDEKIENGSFKPDQDGTNLIKPFSASLILEELKPKPISIERPKSTQFSKQLVGAVASGKRKMSRNASDRFRQVEPKDERNSFLEQIRCKSFNLRPAVAKKPALQGPRTNLNVVAILEKANAIRQAFAGSDEDDDGWSDS